jgi:hypothetical protein
LTQGQIEIHEKVQKLEQKVMDWEKSKEKIKKMLWWDDVAKGLAKLNQTNGTYPKNTNTTDTKVTPTDSASPATLSADGKVWFIHPLAMINYFKEKVDIKLDIIVFYIYLDGRIQKYIPSFIKNENQNKYRYVIIDKLGNEHKVCELEYIKIKEKFSKSLIPNQKKDYFKPGPNDNASNVNDGDTKYRIIYANGEVAEWGRHSRYAKNKAENKKLPHENSWRIFGVTGNEVELIRMPDSLNKQYGDLKIEYSFHNTKRRYANPALFAAMLGSLAVYKKAVISTGSAFQWGSCFPSTLHINGMAIDFEYSSKKSSGDYYGHSSEQYKNDLAFLKAMLLFFVKVRVGKHEHFKEFRKLSGVIDGGVLHDSHFHVDFSLTKIEEIKE